MTATLPARSQLSPAAPLTPARPSRVRLLLRRGDGDPAWVRPGLLALLAGTGVLYLWDLGASGWANAFYSAAAQAGSQGWEAFFYGSSDAGNAITVDKPPAALWVMALSVRLFGLSSWSLLVPEALMGVATVGLLYLTVRRVAGPGAALLAGTAMALTPVAVLMFRFNNPDALLVLLMTAAAYALTRAVETASGPWLALVGVLIGFAFLTKMLQALLVVPAFALVYLVAAPTPLRRRLLQLLAAGLAMVVAGGWWVAIVELVPATMRPYVGGSQTNSVWELIWGYNGLGRITGDETGSVGGGMGWGETGLFRMFYSDTGGQISWLLPAALILLVGGLAAVSRAPRTDLRRAALLLWGGWLLVTGLVFSFMAGIFHAYYTVALAPAIAAVVAIGGRLLWQRRARIWARLVLALAVAWTGTWAFLLLGRNVDFVPWLREVVLLGAVGAAACLLIADRIDRRAAAAVLAGAVLVGLGAPAAYAASTAAVPHTGSIPIAGPAGAPFRGLGGAPAIPFPGGLAGGRFPGGPFPGGAPTFPGAPQPGRLPGGGVAVGGGVGGLLEAGAVGTHLAALLSEDASSYTWVAATIGANNAAGYQLATEQPVMPIGGFNGSDPFPTLAQFQQYVADGQIHWFIGGGVGMRADSGSNVSQQIAAWVSANFEGQTVDGRSVYDLTLPLG